MEICEITLDAKHYDLLRFHSVLALYAFTVL